MKKNILSVFLYSSLILPVTGFASDLLSVHILNQQSGTPASNVNVVLEQKQGERWHVLNTAKTNNDGRIKNSGQTISMKKKEYTGLHLKPVSILTVTI